jgi:hypothetical protein
MSGTNMIDFLIVLIGIVLVILISSVLMNALSSGDIKEYFSGFFKHKKRYSPFPDTTLITTSKESEKKSDKKESSKIDNKIHIDKVIYSYTENANWKCIYCETENNIRTVNCEVCGNKRG